MVREGNGFQCKEPDCGEGYLRAERGIRVYRDKDKLIFESAESEDDETPM